MGRNAPNGEMGRNAFGRDEMETRQGKGRGRVGAKRRRERPSELRIVTLSIMTVISEGIIHSRQSDCTVRDKKKEGRKKREVKADDWNSEVISSELRSPYFQFRSFPFSAN